MSGHAPGSLGCNKPAPSISPFVSFHPFAGGGVLHLHATRRIWVLNASSSCIWCLLGEVETIQDLAVLLAQKFAIDHATALQDVVRALTCFEEAGLLDGELPLEPQEEETFRQTVVPAERHRIEPDRWEVRCFFQTPGRIFEFASQKASIGVEFARLLTHLQTDGTQADTRLSVFADANSDDAWGICLDDRLLAAGLPRNRVLPHLFTLMFVRGSEALSDRLLFHAAVVGRERQVVMFPAEAGCGKTTLAAALAARGSRFYSDELAVVERRELQLTPLPLPMSIKPGSVPVLERYYPGLAAEAVHLRSDGQRVRYLTPPPDRLAGAGSPPADIEALVFPRYRDGAATRMAALAKPASLQKLVQTGSSDRPLTSADVEAMIALVDGRPCWELEYSSLPEAIQALENAFSTLRGFPGSP